MQASRSPGSTLPQGARLPGSRASGDAAASDLTPATRPSAGRPLRCGAGRRETAARRSPHRSDRGFHRTAAAPGAPAHGSLARGWASDTIRSGGFSVGRPAAAGSTGAWVTRDEPALERHHARSTQRHGRRSAGSHPSTAGRPARGLRYRPARSRHRTRGRGGSAGAGLAAVGDRRDGRQGISATISSASS